MTTTPAHSSSVFFRGAGLLLHPTSLPGRFGIGDLGEAAHRFVDWLADAGMTAWQILPLNPPGPGASPYSTASSLSGSPWLIDPEGLLDEGLVDVADLEVGPTSPDRVDFAQVAAFKRPLVRKATRRLATDPKHPLRGELERFRADEPWVEDAALFAALKDAHDGAPWWRWDPPLRDRKPDALAKATDRLREEVDHQIAVQLLFERQWHALKHHAAQRGVRVVGDLPIYVDRDSADVWSDREQFRLDYQGQPLGVAGVPPDYFSETGQLWGNPLYDWPLMGRQQHRWWVQRLRRILRQVDVVRIDHFRAFADYWEVPPGAKDARPGKWVQGPGRGVFDDLRQALGDLPIIAEDLGNIDQRVHDLRDAVAVPGMKVLHFAFGEDASNPFLPHNHVENCVVYPGTHDNDTTVGWWQRLPEPTRDHVRRYLGTDGHDVAWDLLRASWASVGHTAIAQLQDVLRLDSGARMNTPGAADGNWAWRVRAEAFNDEVGGALRELNTLYGRLPA